MPKTLTLSKGKIQLFPVLIAILIFVILVSLGIWQVSRLKEKQLFLNLINNNLNNAPIDIKTLSGDKYYAKVAVRGQFLLDKNLHLYGRRAMSAEKDGYYLVSPFKTDDNKIILVTRGWFGSSHKHNIDKILDSSSINQIIGVILPGEQKRLFIFDNDIKNNIWFTLDIKEASNILGLKLEEFYLLMDNVAVGQEDILKPLKIENLLHIKNDHLEYAITWFALAVAFAIIFIMAYSPRYLAGDT
ncbi:SURF1 family protein [Candidatus Tisiphia endosymbiont of Beris chalybata]|uniref:SURF1 family protein n=1 Tax=Candidatus Tisiphia endosymbiont of Beris chalybata TaxID=3066262 RepID=UPI00312CB5B0